MAKLKVKEIQELAKKIIGDESGGLRYSALVARIVASNPETPKNTIHGAVWDLDKTYAGTVVKPSRGLFKLEVENALPTHKGSVPEVPVREAEFYESFAEWLKNDLDEATEAVALGGAGIRGKWETPDVIGTFKPLPSNRVKFDPEILSAEIKVSSTESITAFGQAAAYRLFSHKVYLVMPETLSEEDQSRIEALAILFGIGFVLFSINPEEPNYRVRVRAQRFSPDMFYVNELADRLKQSEADTFEKLFR